MLLAITAPMIFGKLFIQNCWSFRIAAFVFFICVGASAFSQELKKKPSVKDSLDGAFDLSDYIIEAHGFIPVPILITEPALGNFGGGIVPVFIKKRPPYIDSVKGKVIRTPVQPDITGGIALYTANNTWVTGLFRSGTLIKSRIKYLVGGGYANVNLSFYRTFERVGEKEFKFNFRTVPILLQATKRIGLSHWYAGLKYFFLSTEVRFESDSALSHQFIRESDLKSIVSRPGVMVELDNRDNIFTPNKGMKVHFDALISFDAAGSDYDYQHLNYYMYAYRQFGDKLVTGLRIDGQQAFGDPPFFLLPYLDMRGVPTARYQGKADILAEGELRWNFVNRWSLMLFGGTGKAFDTWSEFDDSKLVATIGSGFRYLVARKFQLRMGVDIARGPDTWAYYIVFGSSWLK